MALPAAKAVVSFRLRIPISWRSDGDIVACADSPVMVAMAAAWRLSALAKVTERKSAVVFIRGPMGVGGEG